MVTALAIPATAMASTGHSAPGPGNRAVVQVACSVPRALTPGQVNVGVRPGPRVHIRGVEISRRLVRPVPFRVACPVTPLRPGPQPCLSGAFTAESGTSVVTHSAAITARTAYRLCGSDRDS
jgi:hypothetical protein